jgi:hypothetical protein
MTKLQTKALVTFITMGTLSSGVAFAQTATTQVNLPTQKAEEMRRSLGQVLTDAQKTAMEKARSLFQAGKANEAKSVLDQAGIKHMGKVMKVKGPQHRADRKLVRDAIIAGDYNAFKLAASSTPLANISQDVFNQLRAPMQTEKAAREQVQSILKNAGSSFHKDANSYTS